MDINRPTQSIWMGHETPIFSEVTENLCCDVAVIGAGVAGLLTAYKLLQDGLNVVVVDDGKITGAQTQRTTAHITAMLDSRYYELEAMHGTDNARLVAQSHSSAIDWLEEIIEREQISCQFSRLPGYLFIDPNSDAAKFKEKHEELEKELAALARVGLDGAIVVNALARSGTQVTGIKLQNQAQFHILEFLTGVAHGINSMGGKIFNHCHITEIKDGDKVSLLTNNGRTIEAASVVVATNSPISNWLAIHSKVSAYRTYAFAAQCGEMTDGLFWDTEEPYHYIRCQKIDDKNYIIVGGEDHRTGQENDYQSRFDKLEKWARSLIPDLGPLEYQWSGQVYETVDGMPYIGHDPGHTKNVYVATGMSGVGISESALAALLLSDLIAGKENVLKSIYEPTRVTIGAAGEFLKENISTASQYFEHFGSAAAELNDIAPGEGEVISKGLHKVAVFRAENGSAISCTAICPHMKAVVRWNSLEKSWDCPAHGSRFDSCGKVLDGPANHDLEACEIAGDDEQLSILTAQITPLEG